MALVKESEEVILCNGNVDLIHKGVLLSQIEEYLAPPNLVKKRERLLNDIYVLQADINKESGNLNITWNDTSPYSHKMHRNGEEKNITAINPPGDLANDIVRQAVKHYNDGLKIKEKINKKIKKYNEIAKEIMDDFWRRIQNEELIIKAFACGSGVIQNVTLTPDIVQEIRDSKGFSFKNSSAEFAGVKYDGIRVYKNISV